MSTGIDLISTLLGIMQAQNCFYYLNPLELKASKRLDALHKKIKFAYCLTNSQELVDELEKMGNGRTNIYKINESQAFLVEFKREFHTFHKDIAYVVTTSGSTGSPKMVFVPNKSIVPNILNIVESFHQSADDVVFMSSPLTFDPSYVQIFTTFFTGSCLLIVDDNVKMDTKKLLACITSIHKVTILQTTPSLLSLFGNGIETTLLSATSALRVLAFGGEKCPSIKTLRKWKNKDNLTKIFNIYGITEVSCWATIHEVSPEELENMNGEVCLGHPMEKTIMEIRNFDEETNEGELWIGGDERVCILDEENYPDGNSVTMRSSGDIVRRDELGRIYFVGRTDGMIKRMGKRMHLQELDKVMMEMENVACSASFWIDESLILFVTLVTHEKVDEYLYEDELFSRDAMQHIKSWLPSHYFPNKILLVKKMTINSHGKVNKKELLELYSDLKLLNDINKNSDIGQMFLTLVSKFLSIFPLQKSHLQKSWAQLGGDSVMALSVHLELQEQFPDNFRNLLLHKILSEDSLQDVVDYISMDISKSIMPENQKRKHSDDSMKRPLKQRRMMEKQCISSTIAVVSRSAAYILENHINHLNYIKVKNVNVLREKPLNQISSGYNFEEYWKFDTGKCVDASPLIVLDKKSEVFIGSHSFIFASLNLHSGTCNWKIKLRDRIESSACLSKCSNYVITACYSGNVYILERSTGFIHWIFHAHNSIKSSPVTHLKTGLIYIGCHDGCLYALDVQNKACEWSNDLKCGALYSSPCINPNGDTIFIGSLGGTLFCINAESGCTLWNTNLNKPIFSSPALTQSHCLVGCVDGCLYAINIQTEVIDWKFVTDGPIFSSPKVFLRYMNASAPNERIIIGSHDKHVYCIEATSGSAVWKSRLDSEIYGIPSLSSRDPSDSITGFKQLLEVQFAMACSTKGNVYMLDINDGSLMSNFDVGSEIFSSPCVVDDKILIGCRDNFLYCLKIK